MYVCIYLKCGEEIQDNQSQKCLRWEEHLQEFLTRTASSNSHQRAFYKMFNFAALELKDSTQVLIIITLFGKREC